MDVLEDIRSRCTTPVIMVTGENVGHIAAEAIRKGATDYVVKVGDYLFTIPLVIEKNLTVAKMIKEKEELRRELEEKNAQLEQMAATDPLTGVYNRRHFGRVLEQLFAEAQRYDKDLACVMIDLDGYKQLNDTFGHQVGDQLLVMAGKVITREHAADGRRGAVRRRRVRPAAPAGEHATRRRRRRSASARSTSPPRRRCCKRKEGVTMSIGVGVAAAATQCATKPTSSSPTPTRRCTSRRSTAATASASRSPRRPARPLTAARSALRRRRSRGCGRARRTRTDSLLTERIAPASSRSPADTRHIENAESPATESQGFLHLGFDLTPPAPRFIATDSS